MVQLSSGRALVVDDDDGMRALLVDVLTGEGFVTMDVSTGEEALRVVDDFAPRLVVLDVCLPGGVSGHEVCRDLRRRLGDRVAIVYVSGERMESYDRVAGFLIGADDYLVKPFAPDELAARVRSLVRRNADAVSLTPSALTQREQQVLSLLAEGFDQPEIAIRLQISPRTVGTHIERVLTKLGVRSRTQAVAAAYRRGLTGVSV